MRRPGIHDQRRLELSQRRPQEIPGEAGPNVAARTLSTAHLLILALATASFIVGLALVVAVDSSTSGIDDLFGFLLMGLGVMGGIVSAISFVAVEPRRRRGEPPG